MQLLLHKIMASSAGLRTAARMQTRNSAAGIGVAPLTPTGKAKGVVLENQVQVKQESTGGRRTRPVRKKHRPKVLQDPKPVKSPATPNPTTPIIVEKKRKRKVLDSRDTTKDRNTTESVRRSLKLDPTDNQDSNPKQAKAFEVSGFSYFPIVYTRRLEKYCSGNHLKRSSNVKEILTIHGDTMTDNVGDKDRYANGTGANIDLETERLLMKENAEIFISQMNFVQGNRHLLQWKGSVVDSVVGVFLTQNVSDNFSSSAYMSLAASFPVQSSDNNRKPNAGTEVSDNGYIVTQEDEDTVLKGNVDSNGSIGSNIRGQKAGIGKKSFDWDSLRRAVCKNCINKERNNSQMDSVDWNAVRKANVDHISEIIRGRGMNNKLAERIKGFLDRVVKDHGSIDLEWLRDVLPDEAQDYLLSIEGLGLKSAECVRLLTLKQKAFPVDTNIARVCVRLGWVPLQQSPDSVLIHELEKYPMAKQIHAYLWRRLCTLDQKTLFDLHYKMITFGKVFCTKIKPNCNQCPMRKHCRHFASACSSVKLSLPGTMETDSQSSIQFASDNNCALVHDQICLDQLQVGEIPYEATDYRNCVLSIEEPATPEPECIEHSETEIEDCFPEKPFRRPSIKLNLEDFKQHSQNCLEEMQDGDISQAIVAVTGEGASILVRKLKNVTHLRTEHYVYQLPDLHPLLERMDNREPDDPCPYLLAIWTPGKTALSTEPPKICCGSRDMSKLCGMQTCNSVCKAGTQTVKGTILIPCRTAMKGSFPLSGTYFSVNEMFADHDSSCKPIDVPRKQIWDLERRTLYCGTSVQRIFEGLKIEETEHVFQEFVCVRGFRRDTRAPMPLHRRFHISTTQKSMAQEE